MIVYNGGSYDLLHRGHMFVFRQLRAMAGPFGIVVVSLNTDEFIEEFKGHPPVMSYDDRAAVLEGLRDIDQVIPNVGGADSRPAIESVQPNIIAAGQDWYSPDDSKYCRQMGFTPEWLDERGIDIRYLGWMDGYSSTNLRATARAMSK
jgi:glycerol-3-phosphate cytidylyltransferase